MFGLRITAIARLVSALVVVGFITSVGTAIYALNTLKVGGPVYDQVVDMKDLVADILPPPAYVIEAFLETNLTLQEPERIQEHRQRLAALHSDYTSRKQYWTERAINPKIKTLLTVESDKQAAAFWTMVEKEFLPAVERKDVAASRAAYDRIATAYAAHRTVIDKTVAASNDTAKATESYAAARDSLHLPADIIAKFIRVIEASLIAQLVEKHGLSSAQALDLATEVKEEALIGLASDIPSDRLAALVKFLSARGEITPFLLFKAVCGGNGQLLVAYLAQCSELSMRTIYERLAGDHAKHLSILWQTTGFPDTLLPLIIQAIAILKISAMDCRKMDVAVQKNRLYERLISGLDMIETRLKPTEVQELWAASPLPTTAAPPSV